MDTTHFRYTPTTEDYLSATRAQLRHSRSTLVWFALSALGMVCILAIILLSIARSHSPILSLFHPTFLSSLFPSAIPWLYYFVFKPLSVRSQVNSNERLRCERFGQADEQGLVVRTKFCEDKMDWGTFATVVETKSHFFLFYSVHEGMLQLIPTRAFDSAQAESAFRALLHGKLRSGAIAPGPVAHGAKLTEWIPTFIYALVILYTVLPYIRTIIGR